MIAIVTSNARERAAFAALCESRSWPHVGCDSVRALRKALDTHRPPAVLTRHKLTDGYSDDVLALLASPDRPAVKTIVLFAAGAAAAQEARQIALGADCVLRDPVRTDVLLEYLARFRLSAGPTKTTASPEPRTFQFAGATINPTDRTLCQGDKSVALTPREVELAALLFEAGENVVTYPTLYTEILGRDFRGDTSNMRVLLGKLTQSFASTGITLRDFVEVIPKTGYRYRGARRDAGRAPRSANPFEPAA